MGQITSLTRHKENGAIQQPRFQDLRTMECPIVGQPDLAGELAVGPQDQHLIQHKIIWVIGKVRS